MEGKNLEVKHSHYELSCKLLHLFNEYCEASENVSRVYVWVRARAALSSVSNGDWISLRDALSREDECYSAFIDVLEEYIVLINKK